jgi:hypothetical protein
MLIVFVISAIMTINQLHAQDGDNRSLIASIINITNQTNPIGTAVEQMMQATSTTNVPSTSTPSISTNTQSRINWGEVCRYP